MENATGVAVEKGSSEIIFDLEKQYVLQNYARNPIVIRRGKGCYVFDANGKRYLDFITGIGVNALGHAHPRLLKVLKEQAGLLIHCSNLYYNEYQGPLAKRLAEISGLQRSFFCNSGAEATEAGLKMIRAHGSKISAEKFEIVSLDNSFHGRTLGSLSTTGQAKYRKDFEPLLPGVIFVPPNDLEALDQAVGPRTAGILLEGIQGEGGVYPLAADYVRKARELADRYDALLLFDEVQCGVGRTGKYFSYQSLDPVVLPDIVTVAKPLACGLPLGVAIANEKAASAIGPGMHGSTFGGGALPCRVALEFLDVLDSLLPSIHHHGGYFRLRLEEFARRYRFIKEVRVHGLMIGLELKIPGKTLVEEAMRLGLLINCTHDTVLRFLPPYIVDEATIDKGMNIIDRVLRKGREIYVETGLADELVKD
ncbi:MAG: aspartate aminotransferase family protein [Bryobacteraceae bacterium]|nr:aspartate aminotransferase family protein [Bryobacteraceae bacterium]